MQPRQGPSLLWDYFHFLNSVVLFEVDFLLCSANFI